MQEQLGPTGAIDPEGTEDPDSLETYVKVFGPEWGPRLHEEDQDKTPHPKPRILDSLGQMRASEHPFRTGCQMVLKTMWQDIKTKFSK